MRKGLLIAGIALAGWAAVPGVASATTYCVDVSAAGCDPAPYNGSAGLQQALNDAQTHTNSGGPDTVKVGAGSYAPPTASGFFYTTGLGDDITIQGAGQGQTIIDVQAPATQPGSHTTFYGLDIQPSNANSSVIEDLTVQLPTPQGTGAMQSYEGILGGFGTTIQRVTIDGSANTTSFTTGVFLYSGDVLDSTIALSTGGPNSTVGFSASATVSEVDKIHRDTITADTAVDYGNAGSGSVEVARSSLHAASYGVYLSGNSSTGSIMDSIIELLGTSAIGVLADFQNTGNHSTIHADLDGVTIAAANPVNGDIGVHAAAIEANTTPPADVASVDVVNSIIDPEIDTSIRRIADDTATANVTIDYSDYDATTVSQTNGTNGNGAITAGSHNVAPPNGLDPMLDATYHLLPTSPLLDLGDPAVHAPGRTDVDGDPRALDATPACGGAGDVAHRDIGADEFGPPPPSGCGPTGSGGATATTPSASTTPVAASTAPKKCKKGRKLKRGRCVKKKRKK